MLIIRGFISWVIRKIHLEHLPDKSLTFIHQEIIKTF